MWPYLVYVECSFALAPFGELNASSIVLNIPHLTNEQRITAQTVSPSEEGTTVAIVVNRNTSLPVSNSECHISTLAVYRGSEREFKISHDGFILTANSTIEVISFYIIR